MISSPARNDRILEPGPNEYGPDHAAYIRGAPREPILGLLDRQGRQTCGVFESLEDEEAFYSYAPGKWTLKELAGHLADAERVFAYRALRIARGDTTPLAGFEQDDYVANSRFNEIPISDLVVNLANVRSATKSLFRGLDDAAWARMGQANGYPLSVRAAALIIVGHERHHLDFIASHYITS